MSQEGLKQLLAVSEHVREFTAEVSRTVGTGVLGRSLTEWGCIRAEQNSPRPESSRTRGIGTLFVLSSLVFGDLQDFLASVSSVRPKHHLQYIFIGTFKHQAHR